MQGFESRTDLVFSTCFFNRSFGSLKFFIATIFFGSFCFQVFGDLTRVGSLVNARKKLQAYLLLVVVISSFFFDLVILISLAI